MNTKRLLFVVLAVVTLTLLLQNDVFGQRFGGRGGGGGRARSAGGGGFSPGHAAGGLSPSRSAGSSFHGASPSRGPGEGRAGGAGRPGGAAGGPGSGRPTSNQLNNFLDVSSSSRGAGGRGELGSGGGAAASFLGLSGAGGQNADARRDTFSQNQSTRRETFSQNQSTRQENVGQGQAGRQESFSQNQQTRQDTFSQNQANRQQTFSQNQVGRIDNRQQWQDNRTERQQQIRDQVEENYPRLDFWSDHPTWARMRITRPYRWASWAAVGAWVGYGGGEAVSYDYGQDVYYQDGQVYQDDQPVATSDEYTQQAADIASQGSNVDVANQDWMPLGVFALSQDGQASGATPSLFLQLNISKEGIIAGTLNNKLTGETQDIEGMADKQSQRVAWTVKGQERPIMETGLGNLTKDSSSALVHFANGETQQWMMVRLPDPQQQQ